MFNPMPALGARLTDSAPLPQICAWHPGFNPLAPENKGASHGICPDCAARLQAELDTPDTLEAA